MAAVRELRPDELMAPSIERRFPVVYEPSPSADANAATDPVTFVESHREAILRDVTRDGAVLLRGFEVDSAGDFQRLLLALGLDLIEHYVPGDARRHHHTRFVFTAADTPRQHFIAPHHEMSYCSRRPALICFFCKRSGGKKAGVTPIFRTSSLLDELPPQLVERLTRQPLVHERFYLPPPGGQPTRFLRLFSIVTDLYVRWFQLSLLPLTHFPPWSQVFNTGDLNKAQAKAAAESVCAQVGMQLTWVPLPSGEGAYVRSKLPLAIRHPVTGEKRLFFGASQFSFASFVHNAELVSGLLGQSRLLCGFRSALGWMLTRLAGRAYRQRDATGAALEEEHVRTVTEAVWRHAVLFGWREGDVLIVDNVNAMHARLPSYSRPGERQILASLANPFSI